MSTEDDAVPGPSNTGARTSGRTRVKSQRALESDFTERLFKKPTSSGAAGGSASPAPGAEEDQKVSQAALKTKSGSKAPKKKGRTKRSETYCICHTDGEDGRPMIECGECNDWFHFDCLSLPLDDAEKIHEFVCPSCEESTGKQTTHTYDLSTFPSPSPPAGAERPKKRKPLKPAKATKAETDTKLPVHSPSPPGSVASSSDDEGSEVESGDTSSDSADSASGSEHASTKHAIKKQKISTRTRQAKDRQALMEEKPTAKVRPVGSQKKSAPAGGLVPARAHVISRLVPVVRGLFNAMSDDEANAYAREMESGLWSGFKDVVAGKDTAGGRYKSQFGVLTRSLTADLRNDTLTSITSHELSPFKVAQLSTVELATEARKAEMEAAKQASLASLVKSREEQGTAIRLGRDGFERAEDMREKEMMSIQAAEEAARERERDRQRRESMLSQPDQDDAKSPEVDRGDLGGRERSMSMTTKSPNVTTTPGRDAEPDSASRPKLPTNPSSKDSKGPGSPMTPTVPAPRRQFSLTSAWTSGDGGEEQVGLGIGDSGGGDQSVLDLSDIVMAEEKEDSLPDAPEETTEEKDAEVTPMEAFFAKTVVWSGGIINPAKPSPHTPPIQIRHISHRTESPAWNTLLPSNPIEISGRVPTAASTQYLESSRLTPSKELIVAALTIDPSASEEQKAVWREMVDFHIQKDRHALAHPYGTGPDAKIVPPGAAKELYLIPLNPSDSSPAFTDLIDGYSLPKEGRVEPLFVGVFITNRIETPTPNSAKPAYAPIAPLPSQNLEATNGAPIQNDQLQALMASLNPQSLQSVLQSTNNDGASPYNIPIAPQAYQSPNAGQPPYNYSQPGYPTYPGPGGPQGSHTPPYAPYSQQGGPQPYDDPSRQGGQGGWEGRPREWGYGQGGHHGGGRQDDRYSDRPRGGGGGGRGGPGGGKSRDWEKDRDNGWGSRRGGGGGSGGAGYGRY